MQQNKISANFHELNFAQLKKKYFYSLKSKRVEKEKCTVTELNICRGIAIQLKLNTLAFPVPFHAQSHKTKSK